MPLWMPSLVFVLILVLVHVNYIKDTLFHGNVSSYTVQISLDVDLDMDLT